MNMRDTTKAESAVENLKKARRLIDEAIDDLEQLSDVHGQIRDLEILALQDKAEALTLSIYRIQRRVDK